MPVLTSIHLNLSQRAGFATDILKTSAIKITLVRNVEPQPQPGQQAGHLIGNQQAGCNKTETSKLVF